MSRGWSRYALRSDLCHQADLWKSKVEEKKEAREMENSAGLQRQPRPAAANLDGYAAEGAEKQDGGIRGPESCKNLNKPLPCPSRRLYRIRRCLGLTQLQFAETFGIPYHTVKEIEQCRSGASVGMQLFLAVIEISPDVAKQAGRTSFKATSPRCSYARTRT